MHKLTLLRSHLLASVPALAEAPERLLTFVDSGTIDYRRAEQSATPYSHQYKTPIRLIVLDWSGDLDPLILPLLAWLAHFEPGLPAEKPIEFDAEIISAEKADIELRFLVTERVVAGFDCTTGRVHAEHRVPEYPINADCPQPLREFWGIGPNGEPLLLAAWSEAAA